MMGQFCFAFMLLGLLGFCTTKKKIPKAFVSMLVGCFEDEI